MDGAATLLANLLERLSRRYLQDGIEEIAMNREQEVWTKPRRAPWRAAAAPELTYAYVKQVCRVLSNINQARFSETEMPVVSCELPGQPYRFQAIIGQGVRYAIEDSRGIALAVRVLTADDSIGIASYLDKDAKLDGLKRMVEAFHVQSDHVAQISEAISRGESILVSGATSTGKTTFLNQLIKLIRRDCRVITVEDGGRELTVPQPNHVHLLVQRNEGTTKVTWNVVTNSLMRLTPDWIVAGELAVDNAAPIFNLMGKGHPVMTTVHAGTPEAAFQAFVNNMANAGSTLGGAAAIDIMRGLVGCVVQLERGADGRRRVVDIVYPQRAHATRLALARETEAAETRDRLRALGLGDDGQARIP